MTFISHSFHNHLNNHGNKTKPVDQKAYSSCRLFYCIDIDKGMCKTEKCENIEVKRGILVFVGTQGSKEQSNDKKRVNIFHVIHVSASYSFNIIVRFQRLLKNQNEKYYGSKIVTNTFCQNRSTILGHKGTYFKIILI